MRQPWKNNCPGLAVCDLGFESKREPVCPFREVESVVTSVSWSPQARQMFEVNGQTGDGVECQTLKPFPKVTARKVILIGSPKIFL